MMDDGGPASPIIRSSWKPKLKALPQPTTIADSVALPVNGSPTSSFLSNNTVSPLSGFRESATVTDVSWTTAFQTPTKTNASKVEPENTSADVFMTTCPEQSLCLPSNSEIDISFKDESKDSTSANGSDSIIRENQPEISPAKPKELSTSKILSTFRNNTLQRIYPKPPSPKDVAKNAAFYSTPKPDRPMLQMPQPPTSAILSSSKYQGSTMRLKVCPCGTCSCPAVYLKDVSVQTAETSDDEQTSTNDYELGGMTQLIAQEIGKYDGFTQQSIVQETAKANRLRPKSVVHFHEPPEDRVNDKEKPASKSFTTFRKPGSANSSTNKAFDARKFFGDDLIPPDENVPAKSSSSETSSSNVGFKKASGATIPKSSINPKKFFGDDFEDLDLAKKDTSFELPVKSVAITKLPQKPSLKKPTVKTSFGTNLNSSITTVPSTAKKLFGDDFPTDLPQDQLGGFKSARKAADVASTSDRAVSSKTVEASDKPRSVFVAKARSIFGEDEINAIMAEIPRSSSSTCVGFQSSKTLANAVSAEDKTTINETNFSCSAVPEGSDVESVYDEDIDSNVDAQNIVVDDPEMEEDEKEGENTFSIPSELFFQASDQICNLEDRKTLEARAQQRRIIAEKSSTSTSPSKTRTHGIMWRTRLFAAEQSLRSVANFSPDFTDSTHLDSAILQVVTNPYSLYRFPAQFVGENLLLQWQTVDGGLLVTAPDGTVGCEELKTCLLTTPGVDPRLIPDGWVENHYRWIVWKLAKEVFAFRTEFPDPYSRLNAECVMQQLKYRYDREIDNCKRPCLRRIVEKDSSSKGMMVLCVSKIIQTQNHSKTADQQSVVISEEDQQSKDSTSSSTFHHASSSQIELTDGWYSISAQLDAPLQRMVTAGRIFVGCKLVIAGAELNGLEEGVDPLHVPSSCHLRLCANSVRLARRWWSTKLGFSCEKKLCVPIRSLFAGGGNANSIKVVVGRVYPLLYVEKRVSVGGPTDCIYRLETDEAAEAERAKAIQERKVEELMSKLAADSQSPRPGPKRRKITSAELKELCSGDEIAAALRESFDPESVEQMLSEDQRDALRQYMASKNDQIARKIQAALQKTRDEESSIVRNVTPVLKVFIIGMSQLDRQTETSAMLSIWRPPENARELLQEGHVYYFYNVSVSRPPSSFNNALLNGTQLTSWQSVSTNSDDIFIERNDTLLRDILRTLENSKTASYTNREIDMVGIVLRPVVEQTGNRRLYFVDTEGDIGVLQGTAVSFNSFLSGDCSRQTVPGTFVATNLRVNPSVSAAANQSGFSSSAIPTIFAQDYSTFTYLPPSTTSIPPRLASSCRHLEADIKTALVNRTSLAESGLRKLETTVKLSPLPDEPSRSVSRTDFRNFSLLCGESGPQRPGSSVSKTPGTGSTNQPLTGHELQKRKMEKLDRLCAAADSSLLSIPSPLPPTSTSARSRSVLKRAFRTPFKTNPSEDTKK